MENNHLNNHICKNSQNRIDWNFSGRLENEIRARREDGPNNILDEHQNQTSHSHKCCERCENKCQNEHGGEIYTLNVEKLAYKNNNFRESIWTGKHLQATLMSILPKENIGAEIHEDTDQYIRVEGGYALLLTGNAENCLTEKVRLYKGDAVFIPAGTWHDIVNIGRCRLKLSSVYAPPHHPKCTEQRFKVD